MRSARRPAEGCFDPGDDGCAQIARASRPRSAAGRGRRARGAGSARSSRCRSRHHLRPRAGSRSSGRCTSGRSSGSSAASSGPPARAAAGRRIGRRGRRGLAAHARLERPLDVLLRARVVPDVRRERLDRVVVAVQRIGAVDAAVVVPVVDHLARAGRGRARRRGGESTRPSAASGASAQSTRRDRLVAAAGDRQDRGRSWNRLHGSRAQCAESLGQR